MLTWKPKRNLWWAQGVDGVTVFVHPLGVGHGTLYHADVDPVGNFAGLQPSEISGREADLEVGVNIPQINTTASVRHPALE